MSMNIFLSLTLLIIPLSCVQIPSIQDGIFVSLSKSNSTTITNYTCTQCLCMASSSDLMLNCLPNNTCQFFFNFPRTYKIQPIIDARLYFLQGIFPNASQCCMPNLTSLLDKLKAATPTYATVLNPRCLSLDNHGYLVTVSQANSSIVRLNSTTMTLIDNTIDLFTSPMTIRYYNEHYYIGLSNCVLVVDSNNLTIQNNITSSNLSGTRDMMFINKGNTFVVASTSNNRLLFFNRSSNLSTNYNPVYEQIVNYVNPHGFFFINDTYFHTTSWNDNTIYSYSALENSTQWNENLFINARPLASSSSGNHLAMDECGRSWFSLGDYDLQIFDNQGLFLDNFTLINTSIFDTIITDNYIFYLSDTMSQRLIRIDPGIQC